MAMRECCGNPDQDRYLSSLRRLAVRFGGWTPIFVGRLDWHGTVVY